MWVLVEGMSLRRLVLTVTVFFGFGAHSSEAATYLFPVNGTPADLHSSIPLPPTVSEVCITMLKRMGGKYSSIISFSDRWETYVQINADAKFKNHNGVMEGEFKLISGFANGKRIPKEILSKINLSIRTTASPAFNDDSGFFAINGKRYLVSRAFDSLVLWKPPDPPKGRGRLRGQ